MVTIDRDEGEAVAPITVQPKPISCCDEELVEVELEALRQGANQARKDGTTHLTTMATVRYAAAVACDRALEVQYLPLDEAKFHEVFIRAWSAGYLSETRRN
ncbi:MAG TPA: hypothetical protein VF510_21435 [Ktedonobacterales bacterium]